jgi:hypothetical protein
LSDSLENRLKYGEFGNKSSSLIGTDRLTKSTNTSAGLIMGDAQRLTRSEIIRHDGETTQNILKKLERDVDRIRGTSGLENLPENEISEIVNQGFNFLQELQLIQDAPEEVLWEWVGGTSLIGGAGAMQKFAQLFGSLGRYVRLCNDLSRLQVGLMANLPEGQPIPREVVKIAKSACPKAFKILSSLMIQGYTRPGSNPHYPRGYAIEHIARQLAFFLSDVESLRLSDAAQVFDSIYQDRAYYFDEHVCFFRFPDAPSEPGEIAVAIKAPDGLWSYDKWDDIKIPISSMRALKLAVNVAREFRVRRYGLITHAHSRKLSEWMGLEIHENKAFLPIPITQGFKAKKPKKKSKRK